MVGVTGTTKPPPRLKLKKRYGVHVAAARLGAEHAPSWGQEKKCPETLSAASCSQPQVHEMKLRLRQCKSNGDDKKVGDFAKTHGSSVSNGKRNCSSLSNNSKGCQKEQLDVKVKKLSGGRVNKANIVASRSKQPGGSSLPWPAADSKRHDTCKSVEFRDRKTATE